MRFRAKISTIRLRLATIIHLKFSNMLILIHNNTGTTGNCRLSVWATTLCLQAELATYIVEGRSFRSRIAPSWNTGDLPRPTVVTHPSFPHTARNTLLRLCMWVMSNSVCVCGTLCCFSAVLLGHNVQLHSCPSHEVLNMLVGMKHAYSKLATVQGLHSSLRSWCKIRFLAAQFLKRILLT